MADIHTSNHAKYQEAEENPAMRWIMGRLFTQVDQLLAELAPRSLLDAGCGEGHALTNLHLPARYQGVDANPACVEYCRARHPGKAFDVQSVLALPYADRSFDVVMCMEVLEHLTQPADAVRELARVADRGLVFSVPNEPLFQAGNAARGKYLSTLGNHPEHIQHWGRWSFPKFLVSTGAVRDLKLRTAGPWIVVKARPNR